MSQEALESTQGKMFSVGMSAIPLQKIQISHDPETFGHLQYRGRSLQFLHCYNTRGLQSRIFLKRTRIESVECIPCARPNFKSFVLTHRYQLLYIYISKKVKKCPG